MNLSDIRIVVDSSADALELSALSVAVAPLKIHTDVAEYVDTPELDVDAMTKELATYRGKSGTACPSMGEFLQAFGEAKYVFCITMTANLSGTYNVALSAAREYEAMYPERRACVIDSRNTGGGIRLIAERIEQAVLAGKSYAEVCREAEYYKGEIELLFLLESLNNLANNGRVSRAAAKFAGLLGIRMLGRAVDGQIKPVAKPRGEHRSLDAILEQMRQLGYRGGKVRLSHCQNAPLAHTLAARIYEAFPTADIRTEQMGGLCSFYAERGGLILGFEKENEWKEQ